MEGHMLAIQTILPWKYNVRYGRGVNSKGFSFEMLSNILILSNMYDYVYKLSRTHIRIKWNWREGICPSKQFWIVWIYKLTE